ncbi:hypothetical protein BJ741DRAFT_714855 [Chytriomyces cf. hyalinus JEL632]|nr:hypothetical protein BJ741DRAFT_714855 [Chytriomyces cf. hyalinus JEL632]
MGSASSVTAHENQNSDHTKPAAARLFAAAHFPKWWKRKRVHDENTTNPPVTDTSNEIKPPVQEWRDPRLIVSEEEAEELERVNSEISDPAFVLASMPTKMLNTGFESGTRQRTDTFVTASGKTYSCFLDASGNWFYIDWNSLSRGPVLLPDEWKHGGYFVSQQVKILSGACPVFPALNEVSDDAVVSFDPVSNTRIVTHLFPLYRPIRCYFNEHHQEWLPISVEAEYCIPEVQETLELLHHNLRQNNIDLSFHHKDLLLSLRENGYSPDGTLGALLKTKRHCDYSTPYGISRPVIGAMDSAVSLSRDGFHCKQTNSAKLRTQLSDLQDKLQSRDSQLAETQATAARAQNELASIRLELVYERQEHGSRDAALVQAKQENQGLAHEVESLTKQVEYLRMMRIDMVSDLPSRVLAEKDAQLALLVARNRQLQTHLAQLQNYRRQQVHRLVTALNAVGCVKIQLQRLRTETQSKLEILSHSVLQMADAISQKLQTTQSTVDTMRAGMLADRRAVRLLKHILSNRVHVLCRLAQDNRTSKSSRDLPLSVVKLGGGRQLVARREGRLVSFHADTICEHSLPLSGVYRDSFKRFVADCVDGVSFCAFAHAQDSSLEVQATEFLRGRSGTLGIVGHAAQDLIALAHSLKELHMNLSFSALQIHKERVYDLLSDRFADLEQSRTVPVQLTPVQRVLPFATIQEFNLLLSKCHETTSPERPANACTSFHENKQLDPISEIQQQVSAELSVVSVQNALLRPYDSVKHNSILLRLLENKDIGGIKLSEFKGSESESATVGKVVWIEHLRPVLDASSETRLQFIQDLMKIK